jgi:hypothetical protein
MWTSPFSSVKLNRKSEKDWGKNGRAGGRERDGMVEVKRAMLITTDAGKKGIKKREKAEKKWRETW